MWLNCKVTKKWQSSPSSPFLYQTPLFRFIPTFWQKNSKPPSDSIFGRSYPPLIRGGGEVPTMEPLIRTCACYGYGPILQAKRSGYLKSRQNPWKLFAINFVFIAFSGLRAEILFTGVSQGFSKTRVPPLCTWNSKKPNNASLWKFLSLYYLYIYHLPLCFEILESSSQLGITCSKLTIQTLEQCEICSKSAIKTPERYQWGCSCIFTINFEHISHFILVFLLITLSR